MKDAFEVEKMYTFGTVEFSIAQPNMFDTWNVCHRVCLSKGNISFPQGGLMGSINPGIWKLYLSQGMYMGKDAQRERSFAN